MMDVASGTPLERSLTNENKDIRSRLTHLKRENSDLKHQIGELRQALSAAYEVNPLSAPAMRLKIRNIGTQLSGMGNMRKKQEELISALQAENIRLRSGRFLRRRHMQTSSKARWLSHSRAAR